MPQNGAQALERSAVSMLTSDALSEAERAFSLALDRIQRSAADVEQVDLAQGWKLDPQSRTWVRAATAQVVGPDTTAPAEAPAPAAPDA